MKILAVYNPKSGGSYHRVKLWSEFVENVTLVQDLTEELVSTCDILYLHWNSKTAITDLSVWREKYGFKIIADIDDTWDNTVSLTYTNFLSQHLCLLADHVICSTEYLVPRIMEWNKNVTVIPNLLPIGYGQFTTKTKQHSKIRVGIGGSISHYEDYMSLAPVIRNLEKQKWFQDKCEFVIIGYNNLDKRWQKVSKMFKDVKIFKYKSPEEYMSLYDQVDVMLMPLLDTDFNRGRSDLKIYECTCKGVYPILSNLYKDTLFSNELEMFVEDWEQSIKTIVFDQPEKSRIHNVYKYKCVDPRLEVFKKSTTSVSEHNLFSIVYTDLQDVEYLKIQNKISTIKDKSYLFEYNPIIKKIDKFTSGDTYTAFFSHKFPQKTGFYKKYVEDILDNEDSDVVIFCQQSPVYLEWSELQHPGLMNILTKVCDKLGLDIKGDKPTVYSNFFSAKADVYKEYVELLKKAIDIMETDPEIKELCWKDSSYKTGLNTEDLKKYTGLDYYPFHTFILERLMSIWIVNKKLTYAVYT
jgi:hypothetical protein